MRTVSEVRKLFKNYIKYQSRINNIKDEMREAVRIIGSEYASYYYNSHFDYADFYLTDEQNWDFDIKLINKRFMVYIKFNGNHIYRHPRIFSFPMKFVVNPKLFQKWKDESTKKIKS